MANRKVLNRIMSARHVSRSIAEDADTSNSFDDGIGFNENKHTIMSNFEEWIKMATDNKITVKNSWNFDLIDYFHDLNVIKDGESINFQRASATLDGCVKIYSNRVESAATETGKLLSGLSKKMMGIMVTKKPAMVMKMKMERTVTMIEMAMTKILERKGSLIVLLSQH